MYFALTPSMVMAGGSLEVSWSNGWIDAYILCGGDFLISWKPLFYDAKVYVTIEVDADLGLFSVSLNMSADVHIWGPDFTGTARLKVCGCEVNVSFGADAGQAPVALDWDTFEGFLPAPSDPDPISQNDCLTIGVSQGLNTTTANAMGNTIYVVDPRQMELAISSVIPVSKGQYEDSVEGTIYEGIGGIDIAPMNKKDVISTCTMTITSLTNPPQAVSQDFNYAEVTKAVPKALWGTDFKPDIGASDATVSVVTGFSISPSVVGSAGPPQPRNIDDFSYDVTPHNAAYAWDTSPAFPLSPGDETGRFAAIIADTASNRAALLSALGYNDAEDVDLHDAIDAPNNVFLVAPQVVAV